MYCDERRKNKIRADDILGSLAGIGPDRVKTQKNNSSIFPLSNIPLLLKRIRDNF
jgi:hypothetical protein